MATLWERLQAGTSAFLAAWRGEFNNVHSPFSIYHGLSDPQRERVERYQLLWKYYNGEHRQHLKRRRTPAGAGPDDNVTINLSRRVVNKGVDFLFGKPINWELQEGETTAAEQLLDDIWRSEQWRQVFLQELAINGAVTGTAYMQLRPPGDNGQLPRPVNVDPMIIFPQTNPADIDDVWAYELRMTAGRDVFRIIHSKRDDAQGFWETWTEKLERGHWKVVLDEEGNETTVWPYAWPMFIHIKNLPNPNELHGMSDLEDADLNDAINSVASNLNRTVRIFSHPIVWGAGLKPGQQFDTGKFVELAGPDGKMGALELARELGGHEYLRTLRTAMAEITQVPEMDPDRLRMGAQSGFALRILYNDLLGKTEQKRNLYGMGIVEACRRLLVLADAGDEHIVTLHWQDPLPIDERSEMEADRFDLEAGLASHETMTVKRGYDYPTEQERLESERMARGTIGEALLASFERGAQAQ